MGCIVRYEVVSGGGAKAGEWENEQRRCGANGVGSERGNGQRRGGQSEGIGGGGRDVRLKKRVHERYRAKKLGGACSGRDGPESKGRYEFGRGEYVGTTWADVRHKRASTSGEVGCRGMGDGHAAARLDRPDVSLALSPAMEEL